MNRIWLPLLALALLWPDAAFAHVEAQAAGGLASGLLHPVSGLDHVVAMVAVCTTEPALAGRY